MSDEPLPPDDSPAPRPSLRRVGWVGGAIGLACLGAGLLAARVAERALALPGDAKAPAYADAPDAEGAPGGPSASAEAPPKPGPLPKASYVDAIVSRNIFDSSAVNRPQAAVAGEGTCRSDASVRVVATLVSEAAAFSSALIAMGGGKDARATGFAIGDDVGGAGRIASIEQQKVCMEDGSCLCIGEQATAAAAGGGEDGAKAGADGGVEKLGDNRFRVESGVLEEALGDVSKFAGQLRVVPHKDGSGNVDGYRLSAIRKGSLFDKLGIKNGDVVHAVNGKALTSSDGALSTYQTLRNERAFTFEISRRNQRQTLEYEVR